MLLEWGALGKGAPPKGHVLRVLAWDLGSGGGGRCCLDMGWGVGCCPLIVFALGGGPGWGLWGGVGGAGMG